MDSNLVIFSLKYTYLVNSHQGSFESQTGLWQGHREWSRALIPNNILDRHQPEEIRVIDNVNCLRQTVMSLNHNGLSKTNHIKLVEPQLKNQLITIRINGSETFVNNSRVEILKNFARVGYKKIALTPGELAAIGSNFLQRLNSIALRFEVEIIVSDYESNFDGQYTKSDKTFVYILGDKRKLTAAQTHVRVLIDTLLDSCLVDCLLFSYNLIPFLGGAGLPHLSELVKQMKAKVYLPDVSNLAYEQIGNNSQLSIWLTSQSIAELTSTNEKLLKLLSLVDPEKANTAKTFSQEVEISKVKLDLMTLNHQLEMHSVMLKHDTHIQKTIHQETRSQVLLVKGTSSASVQEAVTDLYSLSCRLYQLDIIFPQGLSSTDLEYYLISLINLKKTCVLRYNEHGMNVLGFRKEVHFLLKELVADLKNNHFFSTIVNGSGLGFQVALSMELANAYKEFLSGKKNGKMIKILNQLDHVSTIEFMRLNRFNFVIRPSVRVGSAIKSKQIFIAFEHLLSTASLVEMEFPAELQFNIPDVFHKSLIGNGGSIIQSIIRKYNVFIKFSRNHLDSEQTSQNGQQDGDHTFQQLKRRNNVMIRCPMKNLRNIMFVKYEIDQLVQQCCENRSLSFNGISVIYNTAKFRLLKSHYLLLSQKMEYNSAFVTDLEYEFRTFIDYPKSIDAFEDNNSVLMAIKGNESKARLCAEALAGYIPKSFAIDIVCATGRSEMSITPSNQDFREKIIIPFSLLLRTELIVEPSLHTQALGSSHKIILSSYSEQDLATAASELTQYLEEMDLTIFEKQKIEFDPIFSINEIVSPSKQSPYKGNQRSPTTSPTKSPQKSAKSPQKPQLRCSTKYGSPQSLLY